MNGCKYPGTPEPCDAYREAVEVLAEAEDVLLKSKGLIESNLKVHTSHSAESPAFMEPEDSFSEIALVVVIPETDKALTRINQLREKE